jgi:hypothetical protein
MGSSSSSHFFYVLLCSFMFFWVLLGSSGFFWVLLGSSGFFWVLLVREEEISGKPQLMGDNRALTPTSCANRTPGLESFCDGKRRVEVNTSPMAHLPANEE